MYYLCKSKYNKLSKAKPMFIKKKQKIIMLTTFIVHICTVLIAQDTLTYSTICNHKGIVLNATEQAKYTRASNTRGGTIEIQYEGLPDSLQKCFDVATEVWRPYLLQDDRIVLRVQYSESPNADIETQVIYKSENNTAWPAALYRNRKDKKFENIQGYDALVKVNSATQWNVGIGRECADATKKFIIAATQCIGQSLGYGSSIRHPNGNRYTFGVKNVASAFDKLIFSEEGKHLSDYVKTSSRLGGFVEQEKGYLYAFKKQQQYKISAPLPYDGNISLIRSEDPSSIMTSKPSERDLIVDNVTLELLNELGWNFNKTSPALIVCDDIDSTGICSAYKDYVFYLSDDQGGGSYTSYNWSYELPLKDGGTEIVNSSDTYNFHITKLADSGKYKCNAEGDIVGQILFRGEKGGNRVNYIYSITLEQTPQILYARILQVSPCDDDDSYYDAVVEVAYTGSHYLYANVEEEYSYLTKTYFSDIPYYTKLYLKNIDSWGYANLNIKVQNKYGTDYLTLPIISESMNSQEYVKDVAIPASDGFIPEKAGSMAVYNLNNEFLGRVKSVVELTKYRNKFLILEFRDMNDNVKHFKYYSK